MAAKTTQPGRTNRQTQPGVSVRPENLQSAVLDSLEAHVAVIDGAGNILSVNQPWLDFACQNGVRDPLLTVVNVNYLEVLERAQKLDESVGEVLLGLREVLSGARQSYQVDYVCATPGRLYAYTMKTVRLPGPEGGAIITHEDITERRNAEDALKTSANRLQQMFEMHDAVMLLVEPHSGAIVDANQAAAKFYGYPLETLRQMNIQAINILPSDEVAAHRRQALQESLNSFVFSHRLANGEVRQVEVHSSPIDLDGQSLLFSIIHDITARTQAEAALQAERDFALQVLNAITEGLTVVSREFCFEYANPAYLRLLGRALEDLIGLDLRQVTDPADYPILMDAWQRRQAGETSSYEIHLMHASGRKIPVRITGVPRWDGEQINGSIAVITDLSERRQAEAALRASQARFSKVFHSSPALIAISEAGTGRYLDVNERQLKVLEYSREEMVGQLSEELGIFANTEQLKAAWQILRDQGVLYEQEITLRSKSGRLIHGVFSAEWIELQDQRYLLTVTNDITQRKQMEDELRASEAKYSAVFHTSPLCLGLVDQEGRIVEINEAYCKLLGVSGEDACGKTLEEIGAISVSEYESYRAFLFSSGGRIDNLEVRMGRCDGSRRDTLYSVRPVQLNGEPYFMAAVLDITEQKQAEAEVSAQIDELQRWSKMTAGRELRMIELKQEVNALLAQAGLPPRYPGAAEAFQQLEQ